MYSNPAAGNRYPACSTPDAARRARLRHTRSPAVTASERYAMVVRECMTPHPITLEADADYKHALELMQEHAIHHLPVVDAQGRVTGIVAERDLLLAALQFNTSAVDVARVMHRDVVTVRDDAPITHAASLMIRYTIGGLPVLDRDERVIGVITETDLFRAFVSLLEARSARRADIAPEPAAPVAAKKTVAKKTAAKKTAAATTAAARKTVRRRSCRRPAESVRVQQRLGHLHRQYTLKRKAGAS